jgi:hypothetical protein
MKLAYNSTSAACARAGSMEPGFINTPLQRGEITADWILNRFSGFKHPGETAEAVQMSDAPRSTPLKWGVNESRLAGGVAES